MRALFVSLAGLFAVSPAFALDFDAALGLSQQTPGLVGDQRALQARQQMDGQLPNIAGNPEIGVAPGLGFGAGSPGPAVQIFANQSWNLMDLSGQRKAAAAAERAVLDVQLRASQLLQKLDVAQAWLQLSTAQALYQAAQQQAQQADQFLTSIQRAASKGVALSADAAEAEVFAGQAQLRIVAMEGEVHDRAMDLARTLGQGPEPLPVATGRVPEPVLPDAAGWRQALSSASSLPAAMAKGLVAKAEKARAAEALALHGSSLAVGGAWSRDGQGASQFLVTLSWRWAAFDHGQRAAALGAEAVERGMGEAIAASVQACLDIAAAQHEVEHTREQAEVLQTRVLVPAQKLVDLRQRQYDRGAATVFDVLRAKQALREAERTAIDAQSMRIRAALRAWLLLAALQGATPGGTQ